MKTYVFKVVLEPDEDRWIAVCPALEKQGVATWGNTREGALKNIQEVLQMTLESIQDHGETLPNELSDVQVFLEPRVAVTL